MANKTTHYEVFDYWKDKSIDKYGNCYIGDNVDFHNTIPIVNDWGRTRMLCVWTFCNRLFSHGRQ